MKEDFDEHRYFAGYPGKDSMREKARALMESEMMGTKMTMPASFSEPSREHMRLYKKGGHVHHKHRAHHEEHHEHHEGKEKKRAHLHKMQREGLHETERALKKESHLKHGGHKHYASGGAAKLFPMHRHEESGMKRLGNGHHPETHQRRNIEGGSLTDLHVPTPRLNEESVRGAEMMRKGGHMHKHHKKHHVVKKAAGGTVYEHEMVGEKPGMHKKINYEKDMKGMHPSKVPSMSGSHRKNPGALDEAFGTVFKKGGKACKRACGGKVKMAIGGVGKIRHEAANKMGRPKMAKRKMGY